MEFFVASGGGEYPQASPKSLIRLSKFSEDDKQLIIHAVQTEVLANGKSLALHNLNFIKADNCEVTLILSEDDEGLIPTGQLNVYSCLLSRAGFTDFIEIVRNVEDGHNWLTPGEYLDDPAFLISKFGPW